MLERTFPREEDQRGAQGIPGQGTGPSTLHAEAEALLAAGDAAINRALSGDSAEFLRAHRQSGGQ